MRTCPICGAEYKTKIKGEDILIYGCCACHKGFWLNNQKSLAEVGVFAKGRNAPSGEAHNQAEMARAENLF